MIARRSNHLSLHMLAGAALILAFSAPTAHAASTVSKAIDHAVAGKHSKAQSLKSKISDPVARKLIDWLHVAGPRGKASFEKTAKFLAQNADWPQRERTRARAEAELYRKPPSPQRVLRHFSAFPSRNRTWKNRACQGPQGRRQDHRISRYGARCLARSQLCIQYGEACSQGIQVHPDRGRPPGPARPAAL